jgi:hypothetical protein
MFLLLISSVFKVSEKKLNKNESNRNSAVRETDGMGGPLAGDTAEIPVGICVSIGTNSRI